MSMYLPVIFFRAKRNRYWRYEQEGNTLVRKFMLDIADYGTALVDLDERHFAAVASKKLQVGGTQSRIEEWGR